MLTKGYFDLFHHRRLLKKVLPISVAYSVYALGWGLITPIFTIFINSITKDLFLTGLVISIWGAVGLIADIPFGLICDKMNVKRILQFCLGVYVLVPIGYALTTNIWTLVAVRAVHALIGALMWVAIYTYLFKTVSKKHAGEEMGMFSSFYDFSATIAPIIGGLIAAASFMLPFYIVSVFCAISFFVISFMLEDKKDGRKEPILMIIKKELFDIREIGKFKIFSLFAMTLLSYSLITVIYSFLPILLNQAGVGYGYIGLVVAVAIMPSVMLEIPLGSFIEKRKKEAVVGIALLGLGVAVVPLIFSLNIYLVLGAIAFYGLFSAFSIITVNTIASNMALKDGKGIFSGITTMFKDVGNIAGPILGGLALKNFGTGTTMFGVSVIGGMGAFALYFIFKRSRW